MIMSADYTDTLKKIKGLEEASSKALAERRRALEEQLRQLEAESAHSINDAKKKAEGLISERVGQARESANKEAGEISSVAEKEAGAMASKKLGKKELKKVIDDVLFSEFE